MIFKTGKMKMLLPNNEDGLTFLELCLVVLILGLLLAAATPRLAKSYEALKFKTAAKALAADVDFAFGAAILSGRPHRLRLWPDGRGYTVEERIAHGNEAEPGYDGDHPRWRRIRSYRLPDGIQLETGVADFVFSPSRPQAAVELRLFDAKGRSARVQLRRGKVGIQQSGTND